MTQASSLTGCLTPLKFINSVRNFLETYIFCDSFLFNVAERKMKDETTRCYFKFGFIVFWRCIILFW